MRNRYITVIVTGLFFLLIMAMGGCRRATPQGPGLPTVSPATEISAATKTQIPSYPILETQSTQINSPEPTQTGTAMQTGEAYPIPQPTTPLSYPEPVNSPSTPYPALFESATAAPTNIIQATSTRVTDTVTPTFTNTPKSQYPGPQVTDTSAYPGPQETEIQPYPGPVTNTPVTPGAVTVTPRPTRTPSRSITPTFTPNGTVYPTPTIGTPGPTPTELPPRPPLSPPPAGSNVSIWHSWNPVESDMLRAIVQSFQKLYPDVTFNLIYIPEDDIFDTYRVASYNGAGPSLLLGPAQWGPGLFDEELVTDLHPYVPTDYLKDINPAALGSGEYHQALISLPLSQNGIVMYRNTGLIPDAPQSFEELSLLSHKATRAGNVGSYLERGASTSSANLMGLGGSLMDSKGMPTFNDQKGLEWINLLGAFKDAGAVTFNTNYDLDMFKRGRVGLMIDNTRNLGTITQAIGSDHLAIDPWPTYGSGHMSGWVQADSVYLNSNATSNDRFAALVFMGYLLDPNVQLRLAEIGHVPSVITTQPRDHLIQQAMIAFSDGIPYPLTVDENILDIYWSELNNAIRLIFVSNTNPEKALNAASDAIKLDLHNIQITP